MTGPQQLAYTPRLAFPYPAQDDPVALSATAIQALAEAFDRAGPYCWDVMPAATYPVSSSLLFYTFARLARVDGFVMVNYAAASAPPHLDFRYSSVTTNVVQVQVKALNSSGIGTGTPITTARACGFAWGPPA